MTRSHGQPAPATQAPAIQQPARGRRTSAILRRGNVVRDERGDVPGWVLITIMSAGIVAVLWPFAEEYLQNILESALDLVSP